MSTLSRNNSSLVLLLPSLVAVAILSYPSLYHPTTPNNPSPPPPPDKSDPELNNPNPKHASLAMPCHTFWEASDSQFHTPNSMEKAARQRAIQYYVPETAKNKVERKTHGTRSISNENKRGRETVHVRPIYCCTSTAALTSMIRTPITPPFPSSPVVPRWLPPRLTSTAR